MTNTKQKAAKEAATQPAAAESVKAATPKLIERAIKRSNEKTAAAAAALVAKESVEIEYLKPYREKFEKDFPELVSELQEAGVYHFPDFSNPGQPEKGIIIRFIDADDKPTDRDYLIKVAEGDRRIMRHYAIKVLEGDKYKDHNNKLIESADDIAAGIYEFLF